MARSASITVTGIKELDRQLRELDAKLAKTYVRKAMRKSLVPVKDQAKKNAPVDTGHLKKSIKIRAAKRSRKQFGAVVRAGNQTGNIRDEFYGGFMEWGYRMRNGKRRQGTRFMKNAAVEKRPAAIAIFRREVQASIIAGFRS